MRIMLVGLWRWHQYEEAFARALMINKVDVVRHSYSETFNGPIGKFHEKYLLPLPRMRKLNQKILEMAWENDPDYILFWRPTHIFPKTIEMLSAVGIKSLSYNNDDPFGPKYLGNKYINHIFLWYWYRKCLPYFCMNFFYRKINCVEAASYGAKHADILLPYFLPWQDKPIDLAKEEYHRFKTDVVFVGHYEQDGRERYIRALCDSGFNVKIWGGNTWNKDALGIHYDKFMPIVQALGDEYAKALAGADICICFLSRINRDTYTRRCFEIPACGKVMLAERTDDLLNFFKENEEACFFSSIEEFIEKIKWLQNNPQIKSKIAQAGFNRVWKDGHDVVSRAKWFLKKIT